MDEDLRQFIRTAIGSVWALEILLLLRARRDRAWTTDTLAQELRSNPSLVVQVFAELEAAGLVAAGEDGYVYHPASEVLERLCARLEKRYRVSPVTVVNAIASSQPNLKTLRRS